MALYTGCLVSGLQRSFFRIGLHSISRQFYAPRRTRAMAWFPQWMVEAAPVSWLEKHTFEAIKPKMTYRVGASAMQAFAAGRRGRNSPLTLALSRGARGASAMQAFAAGRRGRNSPLTLALSRGAREH